MLLKELKKAKGAIINFLFLAFFLIYFGRAEIGSSKTAYLIVGVFAIIAFAVNQFVRFKNVDATPKKRDKTELITLIVAGVLFGLIVMLANYAMFLPLIMWQRVIIAILLFCSSFVVFIDIFLFVENILSQIELRKDNAPCKPWIWFAVFFVLLAGIYLTVFYLCSYPGQICSDSLNQIKQVLHGDYSNHHPVYQTWLIGLFMNIGMNWFTDINDAVATYTVFQILFISACTSFMLTTMIQAGSRRIFTIAWLVWFMLTPCHVIFSFTIWKDSIYGAIVCLFTVALFRIIKNIGKKQLTNYILLSLSGIGFNLLRSNGMPAFILLLVILLIVFFAKKKNRKPSEEKNKRSMILLCCLGALLAAMILKFPVLKAKNIPQADTIEMLSIPVQQITRVASEKHLTAKERAVMDRIGNIEKMVERYNPRIYDYARDVIRYEGHQEYIKEHPIECFNLWLSVVSRHPLIAMEAWIDQTSGYWNPGNYYWMKWWDGVCEEEGLCLIVKSPKFNDFFHSYVKAFTDDNSVLILTYNVGFHMWIILFSTVYCIYKKRKDYIFALPALCLLGTLLIATLMHDEFRFGYAFYTCLPIIVFSCLGYKKADASDEAASAAEGASAGAEKTPKSLKESMTENASKLWEKIKVKVDAKLGAESGSDAGSVVAANGKAKADPKAASKPKSKAEADPDLIDD